MTDRVFEVGDYYELGVVERAEVDAWIRDQPGIDLAMCHGFTLHDDGTVTFTIGAWPAKDPRTVQVGATRPCPWPFSKIATTQGENPQ